MFIPLAAFIIIHGPSDSRVRFNIFGEAMEEADVSHHSSWVRREHGGAPGRHRQYRTPRPCARQCILLIYPNCFTCRATGPTLGSEIYLGVWRRHNQGYYVRTPYLLQFSVSNLFIRWGESAGSISVAMQILANNGNSEGLFRGAFMQSGGPISWKTGTLEEGERISDFIVHLV